MTITEQPLTLRPSPGDHVLHPSWCDRARCDSGPGLDASHRTTAWRLIPARHWDNEISMWCERYDLPDEARQDSCVELQVAHTRGGRSRGDDLEAVTSLVRLSHVEALQMAAALIAHAQGIAVNGRSRSSTE